MLFGRKEASNDEREILRQHIYQINSFSLFMSEDVQFITEFSELLVCHAAGLLPPHSAF